MATKTAVVTGGTSGLGEAAALALAAKGYCVLIVGRDAARGRAVVDAARAKGGTAELLAADLFTVAGVRGLAAEILKRTPRVDLVVNNTGGTFGQTLLTEDGLERTFALNVMAPFMLRGESNARAAHRRASERGRSPRSPPCSSATTAHAA